VEILHLWVSVGAQQLGEGLSLHVSSGSWGLGLTLVPFFGFYSLFLLNKVKVGTLLLGADQFSSGAGSGYLSRPSRVYGKSDLRGRKIKHGAIFQRSSRRGD